MDDVGYIKLSDFGLARIVKNGTICEGAGTHIFFNISDVCLIELCGYLPPEVFQSKNHEHTFCADYFAIGVTLYEFLYKNKPYSFTTIQTMKYESSNRADYVKVTIYL